MSDTIYHERQQSIHRKRLFAKTLASRLTGQHGGRFGGPSAIGVWRQIQIVVMFEAMNGETGDDNSDDCLMRIRCEPETESYFDVYGDDDSEGFTTITGKRITGEQARKDMEDTIERMGCWWIVGEYREFPDMEWEQADSIGMCVYDDPLDWRENDYIPDIMQACIDAYNDAREETLNGIV